MSDSIRAINTSTHVMEENKEEARKEKQRRSNENKKQWGVGGS